jgi:hypothetical protein
VSARFAIAGIVLVATSVSFGAVCQDAVHYSPVENLERIDVALITGATRSIDMAARVLTDWPVTGPVPRRSI